MGEKSDRCPQCEGTGSRSASDGGGSMDCPHCSGTGLKPAGEVDHTDLTIKLDALDTKMDALQADMDVIKPQIQALYDDLNP